MNSFGLKSASALNSSPRTKAVLFDFTPVFEYIEHFINTGNDYTGMRLSDYIRLIEDYRDECREIFDLLIDATLGKYTFEQTKETMFEFLYDYTGSNEYEDPALSDATATLIKLVFDIVSGVVDLRYVEAASLVKTHSRLGRVHALINFTINTSQQSLF